MLEQQNTQQSQTTTKQEDISSTSWSTEPIRKATSTYEKETIPDSPYWIIGDTEEGYWISMGQYKLTKKYKLDTENKQTILELASKILHLEHWNLIARTAGILAENIVYEAITNHLKIVEALTKEKENQQKLSTPKESL